MQRLATLLFFLLLAAGCSGGGDPGSDSGSGSTSPMPETTQEGETIPGTLGSVNIEQISSGSDGLSQRQVVVAPSADALSEATGAPVPDAGEGTYLAAFWGEKPTGGYTVEILSARMEGARTIVQLALGKPPPDAMVSQALTQPYAAAVVRGEIREDTDLTFVTREGRELDWAVRRF